MRAQTVRGAMVLAVLLLAGCGRGVTSTPGDAPNLEKWVEGERARPAQPLEPLPVMQQFETFEYSAQGMRDPFTDAWTNPQQGNGGLRPDPNRRKEPLEGFPLDALDMVGTIGTGAGTVALVMGPDKVTYSPGRLPGAERRAGHGGLRRPRGADRTGAGWRGWLAGTAGNALA